MDPSTADQTGLLTLTSGHPFSDTVARITATLQSHGIKIFANIDQQAEATTAGLTLYPTTLILFGNPKAGTPLMLASPTAALDLPLKVLITQPENSPVQVILNAPTYITTRHTLPESLATNLAPPSQLIAAALQ